MRWYGLSIIGSGKRPFIDSSWDECYDVGSESALWFVGLLDSVCVIFLIKNIKLLHLLF